jgi:NitT/TauT family transport system substrate-binding protein
MRRWLKGLGLAALILAFVAGAVFTCLDRSGSSAQWGHDPSLPTFTFYTAPMATTPQIPFWAGVKSGEIPKLFNLNVKYWKDVDDLQGVLLAGKGDLWLGHVEGFALARKRGAPVTLLAVTGWRKHYIVSTHPELRRLEDFIGRTLPFTPMGSPAVPVMKALLGKDADKIEFQPQEARQLAMLLIRGTVDSTLAPEPLVTMMLEKVPNLKVVVNLEEEYGKRTGHPPRMPIAGIAVNSKTAALYPHKIKALLGILREEGRRLAEHQELAPEALPDVFTNFIPRELVRASLDRDRILVEPASNIELELVDYFKIVAPDLVTAEGRLNLDSSFIGK